MVALALLLAATPVSLQIDLSRATKERIGQRLEDALRQRLVEEGFELSSPARLTLRLEELHGTLRLTATPLGAEAIEREVKPNAEAWRDEVLFEVVLRVVSLAHEAEALLPSPEPPVTNVAPAPEPPPEPPPPPETKEPGGWRFGAGVRAGVAFRFMPVDPTFAVHGTVAGHLLEPVLVLGLTLAPGAGLFVTEVPISAGLRVPIRLRPALTLTGEALLGARLHLSGATALDAGGVRVDTILSVGVSTLFHVGAALRVGFRLGAEVAFVTREHVLGDQQLWFRGPVSLVLQLIVER